MNAGLADRTWKRGRLGWDALPLNSLMGAQLSAEGGGVLTSQPVPVDADHGWGRVDCMSESKCLKIMGVAKPSALIPHKVRRRKTESSNTRAVWRFPILWYHHD